jgi:uncharacterized protein involved in exopolysaccharide biosynthesis
MTTSTEAGAARSAWADAPRISAAAAAAMLWSERKLVLGVGGAICALGLIAGLAAPRTYTAYSELIVRMGEEYVYPPAAGAAAPDIQGVVNAEMRLIRSGAVMRAAIESVGLARLYPDIAAAPGSQARKLAVAERAFARHLAVETAPQTPAIEVSFEHRNAETAAQALNALVEAYLQRAPDNVGPVERAAASTQGRSLRWPILIVTLLIAAVVGAAAALSRALMRRTFPTPSSAARALDAPVLAIIPLAPQAKSPRPPAGKPMLTLVEGGA